MRHLVLLGLFLSSCYCGPGTEECKPSRHAESDCIAPPEENIDASPPDGSSCDDIVPAEDLPASCPDQPLRSCAVGDWGWNFRCVDGRVLEDDLTEYYFCGCGEDDWLCSSGGVGNEHERVVCADGCGTDELVYIEDHQAYQTFDPRSLCAPGQTVDAGPIDAGPTDADPADAAI